MFAIDQAKMRVIGKKSEQGEKNHSGIKWKRCGRKNVWKSDLGHMLKLTQNNYLILYDPKGHVMITVKAGSRNTEADNLQWATERIMS